MRTPDRIAMVLETVRKCWEKNPDLRLMQLLLNVAKTHEHFTNGGDMYGVEDDELERRLAKLCRDQ